jgi:glutamate carboxypeptidase
VIAAARVAPLADTLRAELCAAVDEAFESRQVPLLRRLVEQPSFTVAKADVEAAAAIVDDAAGELGLVIERVPDARGEFADHRIYRTPVTRELAPSLALVGHIDTVFPRSLGFLDFVRDEGDAGPETGDIVRGPGVLDMKSGLTVILCAISALQRVLGRRAEALPLRFLCNSDEEVGSPSSESIFRALASRLTGALVFEAGRDRDLVVTRRKGGGMFELVVHGKAAHAGNEHSSGVNAIHAIALLVSRIEALTDYARGVTVNVGVISGGTSKNTVPARASVLIDTRFDTLADAERTVAALRAIAERPFAPRDWAPAKLRTVTAELGGSMTRPPMEANEDTQALRRRYEGHAASVGLGVGEAPRQGGGSDGNLLAAQGVPTIDGLGPFGKHFHDVQEWSSLSSLAKKTQALACLLAEELS